MSDAATTEAELARLRAEVGDLRHQLDDREQRQQRRLAWRQRLVGVLAVLTCLCLFATVVGVWVQRTIYDTDTWVGIVGDLPSNPAVAEGLATRITDELVALTDPEQRIRDALPGQAAVLAGPITTALEGLVRDAVAEVLASDQFHTVWVAINRVAHDQLLALLEDDSDLFSTADGQVTLDLLPLVGEVLRLVPTGLLGRGDLPDLVAGMPVDQAVRELSSYLGVSVPDDFGQIVVFQSDELAAAQRALSLFNTLLWVVGALTVALAVATVALSRRRRRTVIGLGIGAVVAVVASWVLARALGRQVLEAIDAEQGRQAARQVVDALISDLRGIGVGVLVVGAVVAATAFLLGDSRPARWTQAQVRALTATTAAAVERTGQGASAAAWTARNEVGLRLAAVAVALALLVLLSVSWASLLVVALALGAWQLAVSGLAHLARQAPEPP